MTQWLLFFCYKKNCLSRLCYILLQLSSLRLVVCSFFPSVMGCVLLLSMLALTFYTLPISGKIIRNNCDVFSNSCLSFKSAFLALIWSRFEPLRSSVALNLRSLANSCVIWSLNIQFYHIRVSLPALHLFLSEKLKLSLLYFYSFTQKSFTCLKNESDALCIFVMKSLLATDKFKRGFMKFPVFVEIFVSASFIAYHHTVLEKNVTEQTAISRIVSET